MRRFHCIKSANDPIQDGQMALTKNDEEPILFTLVGSLADPTGSAKLPKCEHFPSQALETDIMSLPALVALREGIFRVSRVNSPLE
jgi:hypothetical protein